VKYTIIKINLYKKAIITLTRPLEKIELNQKLESDFNSGMLSVAQMTWIVNNGLYGGYTIQRIIDRLLFTKKIKLNPITLDKRTYKTIKKPFDI
jgi:hypothetical protein